MQFLIFSYLCQCHSWVLARKYKMKIPFFDINPLQNCNTTWKENHSANKKKTRKKQVLFSINKCDIMRPTSLCTLCSGYIEYLQRYNCQVTGQRSWVPNQKPEKWELINWLKVVTWDLRDKNLKPMNMSCQRVK